MILNATVAALTVAGLIGTSLRLWRATIAYGFFPLTPIMFIELTLLDDLQTMTHGAFVPVGVA